jgi:ribosomal protein L35
LISPLASPLRSVVPSPTLSLIRAKSTQAFGNTRLKSPSKRKTKKYKLKTHQGAAARWMILATGLFKRCQAGRNHFNSKHRAWKRASKRDRIVSTSMQARRLKKLLPYFKRRYSK